jgi:flagellum-specific peptidoglycan hydrolase FlgJ
MNLEPEWIAAAKQAQASTGIPASVSLAQFGLESGWGKHMPPNSNNPFGIKAFHGGGVSSETTEVVNGKVVHEEQPFAVYPDLKTAFLAHALLLTHNPVYKDAMVVLPDVTKFVPLMAKHYATDPNYAMKIFGIIHSGNLTQYDS